ncbi:MAG TPA: sulfatase/phosphatase domain-containing protein, partial [Thermomicrobiales bacterium]|nr:sulfatase/phosphatase domain-containing protein [Thermomicrobiales bacterium]
SSTYILFLSDNGYFLGEHRQPHGKDAPYDAASRVPMIVRGPGIEAGSTIEEIGLNIDIFPTVAELAGISTPSFVDGRSMVPLLTGNNAGWRQLALIEGFGKETESNEESETSTPPFIALRAMDFLYAEYETGERELYDLRKDPHQISNIARETPNSLLREYSHRLDSLSSCAGRDCVQWEDQPIPGHSADNPRKDGGKDKGSGKGKSRGKDKEKDDKKGNSRGNGPHRDKDNHGKRRNRLREQVLRQEARATPSNERERRVTVGGHADAIAYFRLDVPPRGTVQGALSLRVHVASVAAAGDLVVVLDTPGAPPGTTSPGGHERLGSAAIDDTGWVTVDISSYAANAAELTFILRGREGGEFSVSGGGSRNPPQLASESTQVEFSRRERERHSRP